MNHPLTPEQIEKNKTVDRNILLSGLLIVAGMLAFFTIPSFLRGTVPFTTLFGVWTLGLGLAGLGMYFGIKSSQNKRPIQLEAGPNGLILTALKGVEEIPYASIQKLSISSDPEGRVRAIFIKPRQRQFMFLRGFEGMEQLAKDLENKVPDPKAIERLVGYQDPKKRRKGIAFVVGVMVLMFGIIGGSFYLMFKLGLGLLAMPLCFLLMGISRFASNRQDPKARMTGILIIFGAIAYGAFKLFIH